MKKDETCIVILSYCDTDVKQDTLLSTIKTLKEKCDLPILLSSNRIKLDKRFYEDVNYYIYDETISLCQKDSRVWVITHGHTLLRYYYDYGFSVIRHIKLTNSFLLNSNYKYAIIINYDILFDNFIFNEINRYLDDNYIYSALVYGSLLNYTDLSGNIKNLNPNLIMFDIEKFYNSFNITIETYERTYIMFENFLYHVFNKENVELLNEIIIHSTINIRELETADFDLFSIYPYQYKNKLNLFIYNLKGIYNFKMILKYHNENIELNIVKENFVLYEDLYYANFKTNIDITNITDIIIEHNNICITIPNIKTHSIEKNNI